MRYILRMSPDNSTYFNFCKKSNVLKNLFHFFPGGSVLVMEKILAENRTEPELAVTNDFVMTLLSQGQERTLSDYQKLFAKHGFVNVQFTHIDGLNYYDVMLLKKPF